MPKKVCKYPLNGTVGGERHRILMPEGARVLAVAQQEKGVMVWAEHETSGIETSEFVEFRIFGDGQSIPSDCVYRGTIHAAPFVWHVYESPISPAVPHAD